VAPRTDGDRDEEEVFATPTEASMLTPETAGDVLGSPPMLVVGVDGCREGWVAVALSDRGFERAIVERSLRRIVASFDAAAFGIDIPIGLVDDARDADAAARAFLKGQASSIFNAPPRAALGCERYDDAQAAARRVTGKGLSKQSFHLFAKIREADALLPDERLHEVHPEIAFRLMHPEEAPAGRKKSWGGLMERLARLRGAGIALPPSLGAAGAVGIDDVVDAAAAAWSARRIARGEARLFPPTPTQQDRSGHPIAIAG
jgi:predicted RNase H-like nuclease